MEVEPKQNTAYMTNAFCCVCGWQVVSALCNYEFENASESGYWVCCSNKGCENHDGEPMFQIEPEWMAGTVTKQ